uniref:Uncharacterized protein n=1 Tax=Oryza sativa subsp. japonica TaxID=39947 RepID=Q10CL6_ORYSJ|nr:hypothetical protein LOC_Os03g55000 [Oryza sativa Japonica Group]
MGIPGSVAARGNRRERSRRRWIAAAAITGEQKGENATRRRGFDSKGGSISGVQGIRFRRRIGRSGTEIGWRREAASGTEQERVASYGERRRVRRIARQEGDYGGELTNEEEAALAARSVSRRGGRDAEAARHREGAAGEEGRERWCPELLVTRPRTHRLLRCSATDGNSESGTSSNKAATVVRRQWRGGCED